MDIEWSSPVYNKGAWYREWEVTSSEREVQDGFWIFYKKNKFKLLNRGFKVFKDKYSRWFFAQSVKKKEEFDSKDVVTQEKEKPFVSKLKPYTIKNKGGLREWQINSVERLVSVLEAYNGALDGSDLGVGKTYVAVAVARELGMKIGVVCPKAIVNTWKKVITQHFKMKCAFSINYEMLRNGNLKDIATWKKDRKTGRETFTWHVPKDTLIVFDESHKMKSSKTLNSDMGMACKKQGYKILCASATSAISPLELRTVGFIINLYKGGFWRWANDHGVSRGRFGAEFNGSPEVLTKLHRDIFLERGVRLTRDTIPNFPKCSIEAEAYNMDEEDVKKINQIYAEMSAELKVLKKRTDLNKKEKTLNAMVAQLRARQRCELVKVPLFVEMIEESIEEGMSVAVFVNFTETIDALSKRLNTDCIVWGKNKKNEREVNVEKFMSDKSRIILINVKAGGAGLSLHDLNGKYPRLSLISPTPSAVDLRQATGRVWRDGALTAAIQKIVFVSGTEEEDVCTSVKLKLKNLDTLNDGDLGIKKDTDF